MNAPLLISGGTIVDGRDGKPMSGEVLIRDGRITEIGVVAKPEDAKEIDAHGLMVTPGFHRHPQSFRLHALQRPTRESS
jgi:N-acyl-D-aspartate/D-glutamate deacylase